MDRNVSVTPPRWGNWASVTRRSLPAIARALFVVPRSSPTHLRMAGQAHVVGSLGTRKRHRDVDLAWLAGPVPEASRPWPVRLGARVCIIERRYTIIDDPRFYIRARGGFGGPHGFPGGGHYYGHARVGGHRGG